ncbi:MAG: hypothetical protein H0X67_11725 [Acidobacteria bacterium]|nr:hypothetical protein [Acidobacteriota bacterium]
MKNPKIAGILCASALLLMCSAAASYADLRRMGDTFSVIALGTRGHAAAHDSRNDVYLVVSTYGVLRGRFVSADGVPTGEPFQIQHSGHYSHFPRVTYSPDANNGAGAFLVTWHESDQPGGFTSVHARLVASPGTLISPDTIIGNDSSWWEAGAAVAYGSGSREFLVVWRGRFGSANDISGARVDTLGQLLGHVAVTSTAGEFEGDPGVAYNPTTNEFLVSFAGATHVPYVGFQRVQAGTGHLLGSKTVVAEAGGTWMTEVAYDPSANRFLIAWYSLPSGAISGRFVSAAGQVLGSVLHLSSRFAANDALSLAHNRWSNTFLLTSHDKHSAENGGVHVNGEGVPETSGTIFTGSGGSGNFYPRLAPSEIRPEWLLTSSRAFAETMAQRLQADGSSGTPPVGPSPGPAPPPVSNPQMNMDSPAQNASVAGFVSVAGWAIDVGAPTGHGVGAVHVWAHPTNGAAPIFVGAGSPVLRPDVGAAFGNARFAAGGFGVGGPLPVGTYDLVVYAQSTVTGTFNNARVVRITVTAPPTIPRMAVDMPAMYQNVSQNFRVSGWALDAGSATGTGVDAIHVWAYPIAGGAPMFVGVGLLNQLRPDVGAAFGAARYTAAGFNLEVTGTLPRGEYNIVVFAHSSIAKAFNNAALIWIRVN